MARSEEMENMTRTTRAVRGVPEPMRVGRERGSVERERAPEQTCVKRECVSEKIACRKRVEEERAPKRNRVSKDTVYPKRVRHRSRVLQLHNELQLIPSKHVNDNVYKGAMMANGRPLPFKKNDPFGNCTANFDMIKADENSAYVFNIIELRHNFCIEHCREEKEKYQSANIEKTLAVTSETRETTAAINKNFEDQQDRQEDTKVPGGHRRRRRRRRRRRCRKIGLATITITITTAQIAHCRTIAQHFRIHLSN